MTDFKGYEGPPLLFPITVERRPEDVEVLVHLPPWFNAKAAAKCQTANVARGRHPMGRELLEGNDDAKCGNCKHLQRRQFAKTYLKCALTEHQTGGPATDVRAGWKACAAWEKREP